jgi:hypothetical protein
MRGKFHERPPPGLLDGRLTPANPTLSATEIKRLEDTLRPLGYGQAAGVLS